MKIKCENVYQHSNRVSENEVVKCLEAVESLTDMSKIEIEFLRHSLEALPPFFSEVIQRFMALELAKQQSLLELTTMANGIIKEFWAVKFGGKEGIS